jgi:predicted Co/Zn/Cd cation transporter (cation efflux family)
MILYGLCIEHLQHHLKFSFIFANVWLMSCCFSVVVFIYFLIHMFYYKLVVI